MNPCKNIFLSALFVTLASLPAHAQLYWDANGTTAGAGATPTGTWGVDNFWNSSADGTGPTGAWIDGSAAVFSAGADATGTYTVTVSGTQSISGLGVQEGTLTFSGGSLSISAANSMFDITGNATISSAVTGAGGLLKTGPNTSTLALTGINTYSGGTRVDFGTLAVNGGSITHASADLNVGSDPSGNGSVAAVLAITNGGDVTASSSFIGLNALDIGTVTVDGAGSTVDANTIHVGSNGNGTLDISNGGVVSSLITYVALQPGSVGAVVVNGAGSTWAGPFFRIGNGTGTLTITNGGTALSNGGAIGNSASGIGTITIDGAGSTWTDAGSSFTISRVGSTGTVTVANGGRFNSSGGTGTILLSSSGTGTLNIGAAAGGTAAAGGVVNAATINTSSGTGTLQFKTTATSGSPCYLTKDGASGGTAVTITGSTKVINTAGYNVIAGANTYTGTTTINGGTLALGSAGAISSQSAITLGGGTLALGGFSPAAFVNPLTVAANSTIDFGGGANTLVFANSSAIAWNGTLTLANFTVGSDMISFGAGAGLTATQLGKIVVPGHAATGVDAGGNVLFAVVEQVLVFKGANFWQTSAAAPIIDPSPPGANYATPPNNGGPYGFSIEVSGSNLSGMAAPTVTLPAGSTYPTQNPVRHNGGVLGYDAGDQSWRYGVDANDYSAPTAAERDVSLAFGTYGLNVMGTSFNLNFPDTAFRENTPSVTLTGGTWVRGEYLIDVTQPLTITTNAFTNFNKNADGAINLNVDGLVNQLAFHSDNPSADNFLTYTVPANTLVAGAEYDAEAAFYAITDKSTAISGSLNVAAYGSGTRFKIVAYSGALPSATLHGIGDLPGGINLSVVRGATKVGDVIFATGGSAANAGSMGTDSAVVWTSTGDLRMLSNFVPSGTAISGVQGYVITPNGAYIASNLRAGSGGSQRHAARVATNGLTTLDLGTLSGFPQYSSATSISDDGSVLYGVARYEAGGKNQAVRFTASGPTITAIPFLLAGDDTSFVAQNGTSANGLIAVGTSTNSGVDGGDFLGAGNHAFRYVQGTGVSAIPYLSGGTWNSAIAISPNGNLALVEGNSPSAPNGEVYLYNATTSATTALGTPNGSRKPFGYAGMTADGSVVAVTFTPSDNPTSASYIHNSHGWHDFQTLAGRAGVNLTGWVLDTILGMSADGTLVWGRGTHNGSAEGWVAEFDAGYLAAAAEPATYSTPGAAIVGAWTVGDTTQANAWTVLIFFANGYYMHIQMNDVGDTTGADGFERGQYNWDATTGLLTARTLLDTNGDIGLSGGEGGAGITFAIAGNTATATTPEGVITATRVTGTSPIVGAWGNAATADQSMAVVFLPNGRYYFAQDGDPASSDPTTSEGIEWGTYTWNPVSGAFTATAPLDTNGDGGLSPPQPSATVGLSPDLLTLTYSENSQSGTLPRVGSLSSPVITSQPVASQTVSVGASVTFTAGASGLPIPTYQWRKNGVNIAGATNASYTIANVQAGDAGNYTVVVTNGLGATTSNGAVLSLRTPRGDFNGDAKSDVLWRNTSTGLVASWTSGGTFSIFGTEDVNWSVVNRGDFDGDGKADVLWRNASSGVVASWTTTAGYQVYGVEGGGWAVIDTGDFDGDGKTDVLWHNTSNGIVASWTTTAGYQVYGVEGGGWAVIDTGDFDGDGKADVLWHNTSNGIVASWTTTAGYQVYGVEGGGWAVINTGDFDGDGKADVLWRNTSSGIVASWTTTAGYQVYGVEGGGWAVIDTGDFDGDGKADVLWHNTSSGIVASWTTTAGYQVYGVEGSGWQVIGF